MSRGFLWSLMVLGCGPYNDERWCARHPEDCDDAEVGSPTQAPTTPPPTGPTSPGTIDGCGGPPEAVAACLVFTEYCYECHGDDGRAEGGFNYVLDVPRMVDTAKVVPGDPPASRVYSRPAGETMPPFTVEVRPTDADIDTIEDWILAGAPDWDPDDDCAARPFVAAAVEVQIVIDDLLAQSKSSRTFMRYFTLSHLWNACVGKDELETYRYGLSKLVNSLSYGGDPVVPRPVDPERLILAIDLRDLAWDEVNVNGVDAWEHLIKTLPFGLSRTGSGPARDLTHSRFPIVPADWFVFAAARPPLYNDILRLPATGDAFLLERFFIDRGTNLATGDVLRAGFEASGVSENNRMVERHDGFNGPGSYCWASYDFGSDLVFANVLSHPLHPLDPSAGCYEASAHLFFHDGGELICSLPNGLQAYYLETAFGSPLDVGPIDIVQDFTGPEAPFVMNGVSCMFCHAQGIIEKADTVSDHWSQNVGDPYFSALFPSCVNDLVQDTYRPDDAIVAMGADRERFLDALEAVGVPREQLTEPVAILSAAFDEDLTAQRVAAEFGLDHRGDSDATPSDLRVCLDELEAFDPELALELTPLLSDNPVAREVFLSVAGQFLCACSAIPRDEFVCRVPPPSLALVGGAQRPFSDDACGPAGIACLDDQHCIVFDDNPDDRANDAGACVDD